jgi:hypothetical protein
MATKHCATFTRILLGAVALALLAPVVRAEEPPTVVRADANGCFSYEVVYTPPAFPELMLYMSTTCSNVDWRDGNNNPWCYFFVDWCNLWPDGCFGGPPGYECPFEENAPFVVVVDACLINPLSPGNVNVNIAGCTGAPVHADTLILPAGNACADNSQCAGEEFCATAPGMCGAFGECTERPQDCPPVSDPACGCDGTTYGNACEAAAAGVSVEFDGTCVVPPVDIDIDIKPGSDPNSINPSLEGDIPVAILGSDSFDVAGVDVTTLAFGPSGASFDHSHGPHFEDLNGDGFTDLLAHFRVEETGIAFGNMKACVTGETLDSTLFKGCDAVRTVPDMDGDALLDVEEAAIGTNALNPDTDGDGFDDGEEVLLMGTDPLDPLDPEPTPVPEPAAHLAILAGVAVLGLLQRRRKGKRRH